MVVFDFLCPAEGGGTDTSLSTGTPPADVLRLKGQSIKRMVPD